jgi:hypothetical protein
MMINLSLQNRPIKSQGIVHQSMPPDTILLNLNNGYYYSTNNIGTALWEYCDEGMSIADIMANISNDCGVPIEDIKDDILHFINEMVQEGLIKIEKV